MLLPGRGGVDEPFFPIAELAYRKHIDQFLFSFSMLNQSWGVYCHNPETSHCETLKAPEVRLANAIIEDHWAVSEDGTRIPYHSLRLATTDISQPQPTLLNAYGGYGIAKPPTYPGAMAAFVEAGGVYVLANIRGGTEFGRSWWEGGRMHNKQNCYKDLYAIAQDLVATERTTPALLALNGGSNGGLMAGVAATQRPELWKAVVPQVPVLDLIAALRHPYGRYCIDIEYGDVENPDDIKVMREYSAYHLVQDKIAYPALLISSGNTDPRCPPWHARKFAARLQAASNSNAPILVHIWENAGHGQATGRESLVLQYTEWLTFVMRQLGMTPNEQ